MELFEKTLESRVVYKGRVVTLLVDKAELPGGQVCVREVVGHAGAVAVAPLAPDGSLVFVRQFRYPYREAMLELPAGKLEPGEDPLEASRRELLEETGAQAESFHSLGKFYPSPGYCGEVIHLYAATGLRFSQQNLDEDEFLNVETIPLERAVEMVLNNEIPDGKTQTAVLKLCLLLQNGEIGRGSV